ncbi:MAG: 30S ribosomal protein S17 [Candidatus Aureabacteria bacterium]|nr:30S ribosomal protein S17 [Candidatus Auribacterota bacterium]
MKKSVERPRRKTRIGEVISDKMAKTVVVKVMRTLRHPEYEKVIRKHKKYYAHDEKQSAKVGDTVRIVETAPVSKLKRWRVSEVLKKAVIEGQ